MQINRIIPPTLTRTLVGISVVFAASTLSAAPEDSYYNTWKGIYPNSQSGPNVDNGTGDSCQLCHVQLDGGKNYNAYGKVIFDLRNAGQSVTNSILGAELLDSDLDPFGESSLTEINASTQPGWTAGPNNTHYNNSGVTATDQAPPSGILGTMDKCEAPATETVRLGTPPNPNAFLPGVTTGPVAGQSWDPVVDHSTFHTSAILDILIVDATIPLNIPTGFGTLLCNLPPSPQIFSTTAGAPFSVPVPLDCALVGRNLYSQVGAFAPGDIQLTNALDIVIGTY